MSIELVQPDLRAWEALEEGDVVEYCHVSQGNLAANGCIGVVLSRVDWRGHHYIKWIFKIAPDIPGDYPCRLNLKKIGHIDG